MTAEWKQFEKAVAAFCQALAPDAKVTHDLMVGDVDTGHPRQRDVWIEASLGGHFPIKILVSCKRYARKVNAQHLDAFIGELGSSGAHKGVIYSVSGFTKTALEKAGKRGISCCVLLAGQPPPIPEALIFEAYYFRERFRLIAKGVTGDPDWTLLLNAQHDGGEDAPVPAYQALARHFAAELSALQEALVTMVLPHRQVMLTLRAEDESGPISLGIESSWSIYRARTEAWLVNGSYSFTDRDFKGSIATPAIDTWSIEPGEGWEQIDANEVSAGNIIKFYIMLGDVEPTLADMASASGSA